MTDDKKLTDAELEAKVNQLGDEIMALCDEMEQKGLDDDIAIAEGDQNVYYIDGAELLAGECWDSCTVDGVHPNDFGFYRMAMRIEKTLKPIIDKLGG